MWYMELLSKTVFLVKTKQGVENQSHLLKFACSMSKFFNGGAANIQLLEKFGSRRELTHFTDNIERNLFGKFQVDGCLCSNIFFFK